MDNYEEKKIEALKYKWITIFLLIADIFITYKKEWFVIAEDIQELLEFFREFVSDNPFRKSINSVANGGLTVLKFQQILQTFGEMSEYSEGDKTLYYMTRIFYYIIIIFLCVAILEIFLHILDKKNRGGLIACDIILTISVLYYYIGLSRSEEVILHLTPWLFISLLLPIACYILWGKYLKLKQELPISASGENVVSKDYALEWKKYLIENKGPVLIIIAIFCLQGAAKDLGLVYYYSIPAYLEVLEAIAIGIMIVYAASKSGKLILLYAIAATLGKLLLFRKVFEAYRFSLRVAFVYHAVILSVVLAILMLSKIKQKTKICLMVLCAVAVRILLVNWLLYRKINIHVLQSLFEIVGMVLPVFLFYRFPLYFTKYLGIKNERILKYANSDLENMYSKTFNFMEKKEIQGRYCPYCGKYMDDAVNFCKFCGGKLNRNNSNEQKNGY